MPYKRPTLKELDERIYLDIATRVSGMVRTSAEWVRGALLRKEKTAIGVLARAYAGACHMLYAYIDWLAKQRFVHSMEAEFLDAEGGMYDMPRKPADYAKGCITITGTDGAVAKEGDVWQDDNETQYIVMEDAKISNGQARVRIRAVAAGASGNIPAGSRVRAASPRDGVHSSAYVDENGIADGVDEESDELYRERILERKRMPPHGGAAHDYVAWAKAVPGVTRAWCMPLWMGAGSVGVMIATDGGESSIPTEEKIQEVQDYIEKVRPVTAKVYVFAPVEFPVDVRCRISPDTDDTRLAVRQELEDWLHRDGAPGEVLYLSRLSEAVSAAAGEHHHGIAHPATNIEIPVNALPVLRTVEFVEG